MLTVRHTPLYEDAKDAGVGSNGSREKDSYLRNIGGGMPTRKLYIRDRESWPKGGPDFRRRDFW